MTRARRGFKARRRRNKIFKLAKGFHFDRANNFRRCAETVERALNYAYRSRRLLKRDMRSLWIVRIAAACKMQGGSYSKFMGEYNKQGFRLNRKMLADLAFTDLPAFEAVYKQVVRG